MKFKDLILLEFVNLKLNDNGLFNKDGENIVYADGNEVVKFGSRDVKNGSMEILNFLSIYEKQGYGKSTIKFLFDKLPKIDTIRLKCKNGVLPFWKKVGGVVVSKDNNYNNVEIKRDNVVS